MNRSYQEMLAHSSHDDRFRYLMLGGFVGDETFGHSRWMNQAFYTSAEWRRARDYIIVRDGGCDLGVPGFEIRGKIVIHHINPITFRDLELGSPLLLDPNNLITVSHETHNAIHYGDASYLAKNHVIERQRGDHLPWKRGGLIG